MVVSVSLCVFCTWGSLCVHTAQRMSQVPNTAGALVDANEGTRRWQRGQKSEQCSLNFENYVPALFTLLPSLPIPSP